MSPKPDPRELFDRLIEDAALELDTTKHPTSQEPMAFDIRRVRFTQTQEELLRLAEEKRGLRRPNHQGPSYVALATMAFVAWDLGLDFFEVLSGHGLPDDPATRGIILGLSRGARGQWGIQAVGDRTKGS